MEACNFGHKHVVEVELLNYKSFLFCLDQKIFNFQLLLQAAPNTLDLDAVNIRGQMAEGNGKLVENNPVDLSDMYPKTGDKL